MSRDQFYRDERRAAQPLLLALQDVLRVHMDAPEAPPGCRVQSAVLLDFAMMRPVNAADVREDGVSALRLTLRDGREWDLTLVTPVGLIPPQEEQTP